MNKALFKLAKFINSKLMRYISSLIAMITVEVFLVNYMINIDDADQIKILNLILCFCIGILISIIIMYVDRTLRIAKKYAYSMMKYLKEVKKSAISEDEIIEELYKFGIKYFKDNCITDENMIVDIVCFSKIYTRNNI